MAIDIKILGPGCPKCKTLEKITREIVEENSFDAKVTKVDDIMEIMSYNVLAPPALVINEKVVFKGFLPSKDEITKKIAGFING
jgi:small redox-active disulfide protein 2